MNGNPLTPRVPLPPSKSNSSFIVRFLRNLKHNNFLCLPMIIEIEIYEQGLPYPPGASPTPSLKIVKFIIYSAILLKFETENFHNQ